MKKMFSMDDLFPNDYEDEDQLEKDRIELEKAILSAIQDTEEFMEEIERQYSNFICFPKNIFTPKHSDCTSEKTVKI